MSGDDALRCIGIACLDQIMRNEAAIFAGEPEGVHQMRVAVRRLRAILAGFGRMLPAGQRRSVSHALRWLAEALGAARNLDVFARMLLAPAPRELAGPAQLDQGIATLAAAAERRRKIAYANAARAIRSRRYTALMTRQRRWFNGSCWRESPASRDLRQPIAGLAPRILERRRRVARRRTEGFVEQSPQQRHELRIALKKLRYAAEMFAGLYGADEIGRFIKRLKWLQDDLGEANDVRVGHAIVAQLARSKDGSSAIAAAITSAGEKLLASHEHRLARREAKLRGHLDRLLATEPFWRS